MESGETIISAAKREMKEEAGYEIDVRKFHTYSSLWSAEISNIFLGRWCIPYWAY